DHTNLNYWMPLVTQVYVNRGHADTRDGVGTIRYVHFGALYTLREYVIAFDPPHLIALSIEQDPLFANHMSVLLLEAERYGGTNLTWRHYFRTSTLPAILGPLLAGVVNQWAAGAVRNLTVRFGGRPLKD
ncbi:MAG: SRPBCC family protein, partial [Anaerolineae bacterium]|nr:SRPBCC family protein [Anaerolineae bacterium]